jgi:hypothetical protein
VIAALVVVAVLALVVCVIVLVAVDPGPGPSDVAAAYEQAWDRLDFDALWALSGDELRDGMDRRSYVAAKAAAYAGRAELGHLADQVVVERVDTLSGSATVRTRVGLRNGDVVRNDVQLAKRNSVWVVTAYELVPAPPQPV